MHGRARETREQTAERRAASAQKVAMYRQLQTEVIRRRNARVYDSASMDLAGKLLELNPEVYTAWNFRRETILSKLESDGAAPKQDWLDEELQMTEKSLKRNHKSYCTWHHRKWTVQRYAAHFPAAAPAVLARELALCGKLLQMDERNFHCWGYRRYIAYLAKLSEAQELAFTTEKINQTFSNYSAWHHRSAVLPLLHRPTAAIAGTAVADAGAEARAGAGAGAVPEQLYARPGEAAAAGAAGGGEGLPMEAAEREFELVAQALFTEPEDQAGWFYHAWVVGKVLLAARAKAAEGEAEGAAGAAAAAAEGWEAAAACLEKQAALCRELLELEPGSKWPTLTLARLLSASGFCSARAQSARSGAASGGGKTGGAAEGEVRELVKELMGTDPFRRGYYADALDERGEGPLSMRVVAAAAAAGVSGQRAGGR